MCAPCVPVRIVHRPVHRFRTALLTAGLLVCGCVQAWGQQAVTMAGSGPDAVHDLFLEVELNGEHTSLLAHFLERNDRLWATGKDLGKIGLDTARLGIADTAEVQLDSIPGLHYNYDAAGQIVDLLVPDSMRTPYTFDMRSLPKTPAATSSRGLVVNYDAFAQSNASQLLALYSEQRYFDPAGVFSNTGVAYLYRQGQRYMRYDTSWSHSSPATLSTKQFGDTISSSLTWTRSVRLGGFQWRSNFALRPDLVTFPVPALVGSAAVPTAVDLYINNVRQYSGNVPSGPFVVNDVPGITGAGQATVVTHDVLGRTVATSVPLYVDTRLLAPGLSSYSFEAGFLRRSYGLESFDYDPRPAVSASVRRGVSDALTVEGHAEATGGLFNAGAGALVRLGMAGVVNGALAASCGRLAGAQLSLGYQLIEPHFSVNAQTIRAFGNYGDLAARDGSAVPAAADQLTLTFPFLRHQTFSVSYLGFKLRQGPASKIGTVSYTLNPGHLVSVSFSAYKDFGQHDSPGMFLSTSIALGRATSVNANVGRQNGQSSYNVNALRSPDYDGGWGWGVQAGGAGPVPYRQAQLQYLGNDGEATAITQQVAGRTSASLDLSGGLVWMDNSVALSRRINDGFALVSTDGVAGVPVLHENRVIGTTNRSGHLLVPDLNSYQNNQVGIDSMKLPADARIASTSMDLAPQAQSGVLAHFGVTHYRAASIILHGPDGEPLPPGARVHDEESGKDTIVGYDGLTFVDDLQAENHLVVDGGTLHCTVEFGYASPRNGSLPTIGPLTCGSAPGGR
ncbi:Outer membrane usher protein [Burkholderia multivorans]